MLCAMSLQPTASREIGGRNFEVRRLSLADARPVYIRLQQLLVIYADKSLVEGGASPMQIAGAGGHLTDDDMKVLIEKFGKVTRVELDAEHTITLSRTEDLEKVFGSGGDFGLVFDWLDLCVDHNFRTAIEKLSGAAKGLSARAQEQKELASRSLQDSTGETGES